MTGSASSPADRTERLLAQAGWVRRLARHLVRDPERAEDLVQDTWVAALRQPPRATDPAGVRGFLGRILRNALRQTIRSEQHRRQREASAARGPVERDGTALVEEVDGQRMLLEEVLGLAEPGRSTILLRYFRDLSSAEIARREGLPPATVRSRLRRGLEELRARLDERHDGDRSAWALAFLPWAGPVESGSPGPSRPTPSHPVAPPPHVATVLEGLLLMKATKIAALFALALLTVYGVTRFQRSVAPLAATEARLPALHAPTEVDALAPAEITSTADAVPEARRSAVTSPPAAPLAPPPPGPPPALVETSTVSVTFLDSAGLALPGVEFRFERLLRGSDGPAVTAGFSGALGTAVLELELRPRQTFAAFSWRLEGHQMGGLSATLAVGGTTDLGTITVERGTPVSGRVLDPSGRGVAGARVWATGPSFPDGDRGQIERKGPATADGNLFEHDTTPTVTSASDGTFRIPGVAPGAARLWAHDDGARYCASEPFDVPAGEEVLGVEVVLVPLAPTDRIEGLVLSRDGLPVPRAQVRYALNDEGFGLSSAVTAGEDGRFSLVVWRQVPHTLTVLGKGDEGNAHAAHVEPGTLDLVLRLGDQEACELVVTDPEGLPVEEYQVTTCLGNEDSWTGRVETGREHSGGRMRIGLPEARFWFEVRAVGFALGRLGPFEPQQVPPVLELVLDPAPAVRGRVLVKGEPAPNARVELYRAIDERTRLEVNGFPAFWQNTGETDKTDEQGRFVLMARQDGEFLVRAAVEGLAPGESRPVRLTASTGAENLDVHVSPGGTLVVQVVAPPGGDPAGAIVAVTRGDGHPRTLRADATGRAVFDSLTPGRWDVLPGTEELSPFVTSSSSEDVGAFDPVPSFEGVVEVFEGRTSSHVLRLPTGADDPPR
jgi:RNA polymerase sigma factor (sigma-70 family)